MSFAAPSNGIIVQSGTDNDLSDLANNSGVTTTVDAGITFYDFGNNQLRIYGTVHQDPETEVCIFHDPSTEASDPADTVWSMNEHATLTPRSWKNPTDISRNSDGDLVFTCANHGLNAGDAIRTRIINNSNLDGAKIRIDAATTDTFTIGRSDYYTDPDENTESNTHVPWGQFTRIPCYNYGEEIVKSGRTRYSVGCGIIFSGGSTSNWNPREYSMSVGTAFFWSRGGTVISNRPFSLGGGYDSTGTTWASPRKTSGGAYSPVEIRSMGSGFFTKSKLVNVSGIDVRYTKDMTVQLEGGALSEVLGSWWEVSLKDFDVAGNANEVDIGHDGSGSHHHHDYEILNSANGSNIIAMWRPVQRNSSAQRGVVATKKEVSINIKDADGNGIEGVEMYLVDNPSQYAKKGTFIHGSTQGAYTKTPELSNGVLGDKAPGVLTISVGDYNLAGTAGTNAVASTITSNTDGNSKFEIKGGNYIDGTNTLSQAIAAWNAANSTKQVTLESSGAAGDEVPATGTKFIIPAGEGPITYDYLDPISYTATTDSTGSISTLKVLTSIQIKEYNSGNVEAKFPNTTLPEGVTDNRYHGEFGYHMHYHNGVWRNSTSDLTTPAFSDWDTDRFGGFYKVDRRSNDNTDADEFTFNFCGYGQSISSSTQPLKGTGELTINWTLFDDLTITEPNRTTVDGYTEITSPEAFYDRAKSYLTSNYEGETETIVSRSGETVHIGSYDLDIDADENAAVFAFDGSKITIKSSTYVGNITTTGGAITLKNGAQVVGTYGDISVLPFTITNVEAGSTVQLYNVTTDTEIVNAVTTGDSGTKVTYSGTYANSLANPDDEVRLRITCQTGATALLPYESFGVATAAGISFKANQVDDTIYNSNAIDGSAANYDNASLQIAADYTNFELDVSDTDNPGAVTTQQIYAKYAYLITTSDGIDKFFGAITAENTSNYKINTSLVDLKIQNISSSDMIITGARLYRDDNTTIIKKGPSGAGSLSHDTGEFLQYIQPQVEAATLSIKRNTNLIPGLL